MRELTDQFAKVQQANRERERYYQEYTLKLESLLAETQDRVKELEATNILDNIEIEQNNENEETISQEVDNLAKEAQKYYLQINKLEAEIARLNEKIEELTKGLAQQKIVNARNSNG
jgi:hypothetical protein